MPGTSPSSLARLIRLMYEVVDQVTCRSLAEIASSLGIGATAWTVSRRRLRRSQGSDWMQDSPQSK